MKAEKVRLWLKNILIGLLLVSIPLIAIVIYIFTKKFDDTAKVKADYHVNAMDLIREFKQNDSLANKKYTEKIIIVNGRVSEVELADTTANIKFIDTTTGAYAIFAFQEQHLSDAKKIKSGDSVSIKGSCSGGAYSEILETEFITFKRCVLNK